MRAVAIGLTLIVYLFVFVGLIFHSTPGASVLGRYTPLYTLFLVLAALGIYPTLRLIGFITKTTELKTSTGETVELKPWTKIWPSLLVLLAIWLPGELVLHHKATRRTRKDLIKFHPFLQVQGSPNRASRHTNSHGFRGEEISLEKPKGTTRIAFLGGSTVYCEREGWEDTHVRLLEKKLRARYPGRRIEVLNAGFQWYTTQHTLINYLFRIKDFDPDMVILYHGINDLCRSFAPANLAFGEPRSDYGHYYGPISRLALPQYKALPFPHPYVIGWLFDDFLYSDFQRPVAERIEKFTSLGSFKRNIESLIKAVHADKRRLVLATQPYLYREDLKPEEESRLWMTHQLCETRGRFPDAVSMARGMKAFNEATRQIASRYKVPCVELEGGVPHDLEHFLDDCHYTKKGNARVAELVFELLIKQRLLD